jgi:hypothetical protein
MNGDTPVAAVLTPPGSERPRRFRPKLRYELIGCGLHGHELLGTDAAALRPEDAIFARESDGLRWYRCLRCDSWVALRPPDDPEQPYPPSRAEVRLPLAAAVFLFASNRAVLNADFTRALKYVQGGCSGCAAVARQSGPGMMPTPAGLPSSGPPPRQPRLSRPLPGTMPRPRHSRVMSVLFMPGRVGGFRGSWWRRGRGACRRL